MYSMITRLCSIQSQPISMTHAYNICLVFFNQDKSWFHTDAEDSRIIVACKDGAPFQHAGYTQCTITPSSIGQHACFRCFNGQSRTREWCPNTIDLIVILCQNFIKDPVTRNEIATRVKRVFKQASEIQPPPHSYVVDTASIDKFRRLRSAFIQDVFNDPAFIQWKRNIVPIRINYPTVSNKFQIIKDEIEYWLSRQDIYPSPIL